MPSVTIPISDVKMLGHNLAPIRSYRLCPRPPDMLKQLVMTRLNIWHCRKSRLCPHPQPGPVEAALPIHDDNVFGVSYNLGSLFGDFDAYADAYGDDGSFGDLLEYLAR